MLLSDRSDYKDDALAVTGHFTSKKTQSAHFLQHLNNWAENSRFEHKTGVKKHIFTINV